MAKHYIPTRLTTFHSWQSILITHIEEKADRLGIPPEKLARLLALQESWERAYELAENRATRTPITVKNRQELTTVFTEELRTVVRTHITYNPVLTDQERGAMGLPVHKIRCTSPVHITSRPHIARVIHALQQHVLVVRDSELKTRGKPPHVSGFEIWHKVGDPAPQAETDWRFVRQATRSPYRVNYHKEDAGQRAYYRVRWMNTRNEPGPWSETVNAIIN
jgi:hypothetical protein